MTWIKNITRINLKRLKKTYALGGISVTGTTTAVKASEIASLFKFITLFDSFNDFLGKPIG